MPLVLQLHKTEGGQEYAEFLHLPRKKFSDFGKGAYTPFALAADSSQILTQERYNISCIA
jgi:hypothetical protein